MVFNAFSVHLETVLNHMDYVESEILPLGGAESYHYPIWGKITTP